MEPTKPLSPESDRASYNQWDAFCRTVSDAGRIPPDDPAIIAAAKQVFYFSEFVFKSCLRDPAILEDLIASGNLQRQLVPDEHAALLDSLLAGVEDQDQLSSLLRQFRRHAMVRIAWRDLAGWADLSATMADLSNLADACLDKAVSILYAWQCKEYGTPVDQDGRQQHLVVLGMGKLGGRELNFSSDIDLIFTYPQNGATTGVAAPMNNDEFFVRLCRRLIKVMGATTSEGLVFRVDTDLRPYGQNGPLAMHFDAMEDYYQVQGREWERYAWIKARVAAGDKEAGALLLKRLKPFIYRRYLDFGAFESLRAMKHSIALEVQRKNMASNIKLGPGGIREIEFFGQVFQLIRGGVVPALQENRIQKVLTVLALENYIPQQTGDELIDAYRFLRITENRLQEFADQQTHDLPTELSAKARLAHSMGFTGFESFGERLEQHRKNVHRHFNKLLASKDAEYSDDPAADIKIELEAIWQGLTEPEYSRDILVKAGYDNPVEVIRLVEYLREDPATQSLSSEGRNRLNKLMPLMLREVGLSEEPLLILNRIIDLIKTIEQRTNYLALLLEHPAAISHLVKLANASPWIATFLTRHPVLLDELLDPRTLYLPPEKSDLVTQVRKRLERATDQDLEHQIEQLCIFKHANTLRVAAADVTGTLSLMRTSDHLTEIAETVLEEVVELAWRHLVAKHGRPVCRLEKQTIGRGFAVIAYGKLGGIELGYASDLDLVFLHAGADGQTHGGRHPIDNAQFFARLGQRVIHILTAHTPTGRLYEPDMRLRPSGGSGMLVSHIEGFREYQMNDAWTWEHQALIKARPVSGDAEMARRFDQIRQDILARPRTKSELKTEVVAMRTRMRQELLKPEPDVFDLKQSPGGIVDIEFLVQYLVLLKTCEHVELVKWTDNVRLLETLIANGILEEQQAALLKEAYLTYRATVHKLSLQEKPAKVPADQYRYLRESVSEIWNAFLAGP